MTDLDPNLRAVLHELSTSLERSGYAEDERAAIVEGATEHAIDFIETHPNASFEERRALIMSYQDPDFAPDDVPAAALESDPTAQFAKYAWVALSVTLLGIAGLSPILDAMGSDGGAVMSLFAMIGFPVTLFLSYLARRSGVGRAAGYVAFGFVTVGVLLLIAVA